MELFLLMIRVVLAALLVTAGGAKLADLGGAEKAAKGFGVSGPLAEIGPVLLSLFEIVIGGTLLCLSARPGRWRRCWCGTATRSRSCGSSSSGWAWPEYCLRLLRICSSSAMPTGRRD